MAFSFVQIVVRKGKRVESGHGKRYGVLGRWQAVDVEFLGKQLKK